MGGVGALVTLELPPDSPVLELPWIITFGPLNDEEEWEPVVCGPYERAHAMALAESVVADEELMAVVEPLQPHVSIDQIRDDIAAARLASQADLDPEFVEEEYPLGEHEETRVAEPTPPPSPEQVRVGFAHIAARLTGN